jgi:hypothetical protein
MQKPNIDNDTLFASLYDVSDWPKQRYRISTDRVTDLTPAIEGLLRHDSVAFDLSPEMQEAATALHAEIKTWRKQKHNSVRFEVCRVRSPRWGDLVLHVRLFSPSFTPSTKYVTGRLVHERDYQELEKYLLAKMKAGPYPLPEPVCNQA